MYMDMNIHTNYRQEILQVFFSYWFYFQLRLLWFLSYDDDNDDDDNVYLRRIHLQQESRKSYDSASFLIS
jgi:hypothetical protein